jgi:signal transduction histidine kinase
MFYALETKYNNGSGLDASNAAIFLFFTLGAWGAGRLILNRALQAQLAYADTEQFAHTAVADERARIARELHTSSLTAQLPAGLDLVVFRVVQEALTNVRKHTGGARASVRLSYAWRALEIDVRDDGEAVASAPRSGGHGLIGMRERVTLFGGTLEAGSADDALLAPAVTRRLIERYVRRRPADASLAARFQELTERELEVLQLLTRGLSNAEIGARLFLSAAT